MLLTLLAPVPEQSQIPTLWQNSEVRVAVEVAFRSNPLDATLLWEDITEYVNEISITRGRSGELDRFQPSTAAITVSSTSRDFDPEYASGPWYGYVLPNRPIRVRVQYDAGSGLVEYFVWQGFVDEWPQDYTGLAAAQVAIPCSDAFAFISNRVTVSPFETRLIDDLLGDDPPTAWFRLGETTGTVAVDQIAGDNATYVQGPTFGAGLVASSTDGSVGLTATAGVEFPGTVITQIPFAVEFMFQGDDLSPAADSYLFWCSHLTTPSYAFATSYVSLEHLGSGTIEYRVSDSLAGYTRLYGTFAAAAMFDGEPHHVVFRVDEESDPRLFIDGVLASRAVSTSGKVLASEFTPMIYGALGAHDNAPTVGVIGSYDELLIWDGVSPTATRIAARAEAALGFPGSTTAERVDSVLDTIGWPAWLRDIGTGSTVCSTDGMSGGVYDQIMVLADTEGGQCYVDGRGRIVFRGRSEIGSDTRSAVSQAVFGDA